MIVLILVSSIFLMNPAQAYYELLGPDDFQAVERESTTISWSFTYDIPNQELGYQIEILNPPGEDTSQAGNTVFILTTTMLSLNLLAVIVRMNRKRVKSNL